LQDFRNIARADLELAHRFVVLSGANAQGKTNLLEAIYLLLAQRPFRARKLTELIRFGAPQSRLTSLVSVAGTRALIELEIRSGRKLLRVDGKSQRKSHQPVILFGPDDLRAPKEGPKERRQLLDRAIATVWPEYVALAREYAHVLRSRNQVLRKRAADETLLAVYDEQLAASGATIRAARARYVGRIAESFSRSFEAIFTDTENEARLHYQVAGISQIVQPMGEVALALKAQLAASRREDLARATTTRGPHHDDVLFELDGRAARQFASQGQARALVLAFRIAQMLDCAELLGDFPVLLLDDVSSELDPQKNRQLFDFLLSIDSQVFITTTRPTLIEVSENRQDFQVVKGAFSAV
jgi:DNA replication and repair protein RecF